MSNNKFVKNFKNYLIITIFLITFEISFIKGIAEFNDIYKVQYRDLNISKKDGEKFAEDLNNKTDCKVDTGMSPLKFITFRKELESNFPSVDSPIDGVESKKINLNKIRKTVNKVATKTKFYNFDPEASDDFVKVRDNEQNFVPKWNSSPKFHQQNSLLSQIDDLINLLPRLKYSRIKLQRKREPNVAEIRRLKELTRLIETINALEELKDKLFSKKMMEKSNSHMTSTEPEPDDDTGDDNHQFDDKTGYVAVKRNQAQKGVLDSMENLAHFLHNITGNETKNNSSEKKGDNDILSNIGWNHFLDTLTRTRTKELYFFDDKGQPQLASLNASVQKFEGENVDKRSNIEFFLYTTSKLKPVQLYLDDIETLKKSPFNPELNTKIIIHGYTNTYHGKFSQRVKNAYLTIGKFNIILVNWGMLCKSPFYLTAKKNTMLVGNYLAQFVDTLVNHAKLKLSDLHIIGHCLGAHIGGIVGKNMNNGKPERLTALDPTYPLYEMESVKWMMTDNDATLVDVIHTSGDDLGFMEPLGHVDFYPNNGKTPQPGCSDKKASPCSHSRSWLYFIESISNGEAFPARECPSFHHLRLARCYLGSPYAPYMGEKAYKEDECGTGLYYTQTKERKPFAIKELTFRLEIG